MQKSVITNQNEVEQIQKEIEEIKSGLQQEGSVVRQMYASKSPKKDMLLEWAKRLEKLHEFGVYKEPLATISSYIKSELRKMNLNDATLYVHEVLPFKYKDSNMMNHTNEEKDLNGSTVQSSSIETIRNYGKENSLALEDVDADIEILKQYKKKLEESEYVSKLNLEEYKQFLLDKKQCRQRLQDVLDGREKVTVSTLHIFFHYFTKSNKEYIFSKYVLHLKDFADFTSKQALKILRGRLSKLPKLYEPKSRVEAMNSGFYGAQCGECGSWRLDIIVKIDHETELPKDFLHCFACGIDAKIKSASLPKI